MADLTERERRLITEAEARGRAALAKEIDADISGMSSIVDSLGRRATLLEVRLRVSYLAASPAPPPPAERDGEGERRKIETELRREWWSNHGCPLSARYGDDGEMQCSARGCFVDFKRTPLDELRTVVMVKRGQSMNLLSLPAAAPALDGEERAGGER